MNNILKIMLLALCSCVLTACEGGDISSVKNGILDFDRSTTIGNVLDSYKYFSSKKWSSFQDQQKRTIVQFEAEIDKSAAIQAANQTYIVRRYSSAERYVTKCLEMQECPLHSARTSLIIQFAILPGDSFEVVYVGTRLNNGVDMEVPMEACLRHLYSGKLFGGDRGTTTGFGAQQAYLAYEWLEANNINVYE